jgi:tRNA (guanine37-N1)-methyltransferase
MIDSEVTGLNISGNKVNTSIIKRAVKFKKLNIRVHNIRDYTLNKHKKVDDRPFGGGQGMVIQCQAVLDAVSKLRKGSKRAKLILMSPQGKTFKHSAALRLSRQRHLIIMAGHYEGVDERIRDVVDEEISIGDYVLTGGELPAMVLIDALTRLIPGVLGDKRSSHEDTFSAGLLEYPHYTRPADYKGRRVPEVLLSGNHASVTRWRRLESIKRTISSRPDLIKHIDQLDINV